MADDADFLWSGEIVPFNSSPLSKVNIEQSAVGAALKLVEEQGAQDVYLKLKRMEAALKAAIAAVNPIAFESFGQSFQGETSGSVEGARVSISYPEKWEYGAEVAEVEARHKLEMEAVKAKERADGTAKKIPGRGVLTITLNP